MTRKRRETREGPVLPKVGRPPRAGRAADTSVRVACTVPEREWYARIADARGLTVSDLVRELLEREAKIHHVPR